MKKLLFISLSILFIQSNTTAQEKVSKKVLFMGNSYTYFWNMPQNVALLGADKGHSIQTAQSTAGGSSWSHHWKGERGLESIKKIKEGNYDLVVIQNHSRSAIDRPDSLIHYGKLFNDIIKKSGAQTMLYMSWSREWDPFMIDEISKKYEELGRIINAPVAPVGRAWEKARQLRPDFPLYFPDGSHQSALGTYLTACVFYAMITHESPVGLTSRLIMKDENGEKLYINIQTSEDAIFCQKVAAMVCNDYLD